MAYLGVPQSKLENLTTNVQIVNLSASFDGTTVTFNLQDSYGNPVYAVADRALLVTLGGITQKPGVDYTTNATTITFTTAPVSNLTIEIRKLYGVQRLLNVNDGVISPIKLTTGGPLWNSSGNVTISGDLNVAGAFNSGGNGLFWEDNEKANFGTGNDLKIYHNGTNSYIENDTGSLTFKIAGSEKLHITSDGNLGIGDSNNTSYDTNAQNVLIASDGDTGITIRSAGSTPFAMIHFADGTTGNSQKRAGRIVYQHDGDNLSFNTADTERLRLTGDGKVYFGNYASPGAKSYILKETSGSYKFNIFASESTTDNRIITVNSRSNVEALRISSNAIPRVGINTTGPNALLTVGPVDSPTFYRGTAAIKATNDDNSIDTCLYLEEASGAEGWQLSVASNGELNFHNSGASTYTLKLGDDDLVTARALHVTHNITPTSGRGIEIFAASAGVGQISSFNRTGGSWDELRLKGSEVAIYTGTSNSLGLYLQSTQSTLYGTSDGILNLDTTDGRGAFIRFKENGTSKGWAGCSEGLGTGGDQDDFGIRAVGGFRVKTGTSNRIEISEEGQILFRPITGGFTTSGAAGTFPGAAVAIDCHGVGPGTGTNIPQYGLYVDAVGSSNDATLMTGIYAVSKQNVENSAIGVHGLYERDWSSYTKKIGGLFQAPARGDRYATLSMNPGGGNFINTTDTGHANKLATGGNRPDGAADGSASYGDCTGLWGDIFKSDTATGTVNKMVAIKATNRATHAALRVGLLVGMVDGNDSTDNRKNTQFVEYYTNSNHQRYYARNHVKEVNTHYPIETAADTGARNTTYAVQTGKYYYKKDVGANQYSWYYFNCKGASYARCGRLWIDIAWTTGHASGMGEGTYSVAYTIHHGDQDVQIRRFTRFHEYFCGGSYYGWSSNPTLDIFQSTSTGDSAGIYLRVRGHISWGGYLINAIRIKSDENDYGFSKESSFKFVSHTTPSDAVSSATSPSSPST